MEHPWENEIPDRKKEGDEKEASLKDSLCGNFSLNPPKTCTTMQYQTNTHWKSQSVKKE